MNSTRLPILDGQPGAMLHRCCTDETRMLHVFTLHTSASPSQPTNMHSWCIYVTINSTINQIRGKSDSVGRICFSTWSYTDNHLVIDRCRVRMRRNDASGVDRVTPWVRHASEKSCCSRDDAQSNNVIHFTPCASPTPPCNHHSSYTQSITCNLIPNYIIANSMWIVNTFILRCWSDLTACTWANHSRMAPT